MALWPQYTVGIILALKFIGDMFHVSRARYADGVAFWVITIGVIVNALTIYALHAGGFW